jgi:hypothetical protein
MIVAVDVVLQKRPTWIRVVGQLVAVLCATSVPACIIEAPRDNWGLGLFLGGGLAMLVLAIVSRSATTTARGPLNVGAEGISVGEHTVPAADIPSGLVCHVIDSRGIVLGVRGGKTTLDVDESMLGHVLDALRIHYRARPRFPVLERTHGERQLIVVAAVFVVAAILAALIVSAGFVMALPLGCAGVVAVVLALRKLRQRTLTVGADGIAVRNAFGTETLLPYSNVRSITQTGVDVSISLEDGKESRFGFGLNPTGDYWQRCLRRASMLTAILETTRTAYQRAGALGEAGRKAAILARGGRPVTEWVNALRSLNETQASFRSATIPDDELWRITEDPTERQPVRVAAAVALRDRLDDHGTQRLRVVADSCAAPRLRIALDAAVDRNDASLAEALAQLEDAEQAAGPAETAKQVPR